MITDENSKFGPAYLPGTLVMDLPTYWAIQLCAAIINWGRNKGIIWSTMQDKAQQAECPKGVYYGKTEAYTLACLLKPLLWSLLHPLQRADGSHPTGVPAGNVRSVRIRT